MAEPEAPVPPCIVIERTPANDVYLVLDRLLPADRVGALVRDPEAFLSEHAAELRFLRQALAARLGPPPVEEPAAPAAGPDAAPAPPEEDLLSPDSSLLL